MKKMEGLLKIAVGIFVTLEMISFSFPLNTIGWIMGGVLLIEGIKDVGLYLD